MQERSVDLLPRSGGERPSGPSETPLAQGLSYVPYLAAGPGLSFPSRAQVDLAAGLVDAQPALTDPTRGVVRRFAVTLGPGVVRVLSQVRGEEGEATRTGHVPGCLATVAMDPRECDSGCLLDSDVMCSAPAAHDVGACFCEPEEEPAKRSRIMEWSRKSRSRMVRTMTELDWQPVVECGEGRRPAMVTLTLPGSWEELTPTAKTFKRMVDALRKRWEREWGPLHGVWKLEFQRRGAPHLHLYTAVPYGQTFKEWLSRAWYEVVGSGDERHLRAGTGIDWGEGLRAADPKRLGIYFAKRASAHNVAESKEYQHVVPELWREEGPGRFWGYWRMEKATALVELDQVQFVQLRRLLRRYVRSQRRTRDVHRREVDLETGEVRKGRKVRRRYELRQLRSGRMSGGFVLLNDAPRWLAQAARWQGLAAGG